MSESQHRATDILEVRVREDKLGEVLRGLAGRVGLLELWVQQKDQTKEDMVNMAHSCQIEEENKQFKRRFVEWQERIQLFEKRVNDMYGRSLCEQMSALQHQMLLMVQRQEFQKVLQELKEGLDSNRILLQSHIEEQRKYNTVVGDKMAKVDELCQSGLNNLQLLTREVQNMQDTTHSSSKLYPKKSRISARKSIADLLNQRSAQTLTNKTLNTTIEHSSLSIKVQALEKALSDLSARHQQPSYSKFQQQLASRRSSFIQGDAMSGLKGLVDMYMASSSQQVSRLSSQMKQIRFKHEILQQSIDAVMRKVSKLNNLQAVLQTRLADLEKMRVDSHSINEITLRFRQIQSSLQEHQKPKFPTLQTYSADLKKLNEQIATINTALIKTAREEDTKTAFHFIEAKIRELVTIVASKFEEEKQGAINRTQPMRCLTCDKEADLPVIRIETQPLANSLKNCQREGSSLKRNPRRTCVRTKTDQ